MNTKLQKIIAAGIRVEVDIKYYKYNKGNMDNIIKAHKVMTDDATSLVHSNLSDEIRNKIKETDTLVILILDPYSKLYEILHYDFDMAIDQAYELMQNLGKIES